MDSIGRRRTLFPNALADLTAPAISSIASPFQNNWLLLRPMVDEEKKLKMESLFPREIK
jgi:hypothetical protein